MNDDVTFRPHRSYTVAACALAVLALIAGVYLGVTETRGVMYVLGTSAVFGLLTLLPLWTHRSWIRLTSESVIQMNMWTRTWPWSTIQTVRADPTLRYSPVVLTLKSGKRVVLNAASSPFEVAAEVMTRLRLTHRPVPERSLTNWERDMIDRLSDSPSERRAHVRASLPFLVVTGTCECGCASFDVRDSRSPAQPQPIFQYSTGATARGVAATLWVGPDHRPLAVGIDNERGMPPPDPVAIRVAGRSNDPRLPKPSKT